MYGTPRSSEVEIERFAPRQPFHSIIQTSSYASLEILRAPALNAPDDDSSRRDQFLRSIKHRGVSIFLLNRITVPGTSVSSHASDSSMQTFVRRMLAARRASNFDLTYYGV